MRAGVVIAVLVSVVCLAVGTVDAAILTGGVPNPDYQVGGTNVMRLWLKADAINTNAGSGEVRVSGGTTYVTNWVDQSSWTNDATQETDANQPYYVANAIGTNPAVRFGAGGVTNFLKADAAAPSLTDEFTWFIVMRVTPGADIAAPALAASSTQPGRHELIWQASGRFDLDVIADNWPVGVQFYVVSGYQHKTGLWHNAVFRWRTDTDVATIGQDGGLFTKTSPNPVGTVTPDMFTVGTQRYWDHVTTSYKIAIPLDGEIAELIVYSAPLSDADIDDIGLYLQNKYDLPGSYVSSSSWSTNKLMKNRQPNPEYRVGGDRTMLLWLAADAIDTNDSTQVSGGNVKRWIDRSRVGAWAECPTSGREPDYAATAANGKPAVSFAGATDRLNASAVAPRMTDYYTVFMVLKALNYTAAQIPCMAGLAGDTTWHRRTLVLADTSAAQGQWVSGANPEGQYAGGYAGLGANVWINHLYGWDTSTERCWFGTNGVIMTAAPGTAVGATTPDTFAVGMQIDDVNPFGGYMSELIIYDSLLSSNQINEVGYYLQDKYGLTGNFTNPYAGGAMFIVR